MAAAASKGQSISAAPNDQPSPPPPPTTPHRPPPPPQRKGPLQALDVIEALRLRQLRCKDSSTAVQACAIQAQFPIQALAISGPYHPARSDWRFGPPATPANELRGVYGSLRGCSFGLCGLGLLGFQGFYGFRVQRLCTPIGVLRAGGCHGRGISAVGIISGLGGLHRVVGL